MTTGAHQDRSRQHLERVLERRHFQPHGGHRTDDLPTVHRTLDELPIVKAKEANRTRQPGEDQIFNCRLQKLRWTKFKSLGHPAVMYASAGAVSIRLRYWI